MPLNRTGVSSRTIAGPHVDSGRAWLVDIAAFLASFVTFGVTYCFGVFMKPMQAEFHCRHVFITTLFSTLAIVSCVLSPFTGEVADKHGPRRLMGLGALLMGAGLFLTARVHSLTLVYMTYGVCLGAAIALSYIPAIAAVGKWFKRFRPIALGIAISGIGVGTMVAAPVSAILIRRYGWRSAFEIFGYASTALLLIAAALAFRAPQAETKKQVSVKDAVRTPAFFFLYASLFLARMAVYVSMIYLPAYSEDIGIGSVAGAALIGYIGAASIVGRLGLDAMTSRFGLIRIYQASYAILVVGFVLWLLAHSYPALIWFAIVMGVGYGGLAAMYTAVGAALFGTEALGELVGILFTSFGLSCLVGPPLAALLVEYTHDYKYPVFVSLAAAVMAFVLVLPLRKHSQRQMQQAAAAD